jgi:hypothetical protein
LGPSPALLLEDAATNLLPYSEDFSHWSTIGTVTVTPGQPDPFGGTAATLISDVDSGVSAAVYYTGWVPPANDSYVYSIFLAQDPSSSVNIFRVYDVTSASTLADATVTWSGGVPTVALRSGTGTPGNVEGPYLDAAGRSWYRVSLQVPGIVAAHTQRVYLYPTDATVSLTGSVYAFGAQVERYYVPTSYIRTAGAAVTRSADTLSYAIGFPPQAMTIYTDLFDLGLVAQAPSGGVPRGAQLGSNDATYDTLFGWIIASSHYAGRHNATPSGGNVTSTPGGTQPARGQRVEVRTVMQADGSVICGTAIQGAAESVGSATSALALIGAWATQTLTVAAVGTKYALALRSLRIAAGVRTMDQMRQAL